MTNFELAYRLALLKKHPLKLEEERLMLDLVRDGMPEPAAYKTVRGDYPLPELIPNFAPIENPIAYYGLPRNAVWLCRWRFDRNCKKYIFGDTEDNCNPSKLREFIGNGFCLNVLVCGPFEAVEAVIQECGWSKIPLVLWFYDKKSDDYVATRCHSCPEKFWERRYMG